MFHAILLAAVLGEVNPTPPVECNPMPLPPVVVIEQKATPIPTTYRLPGPRNHFRCGHCGSPNCLMFLGDHLRRSHGYSTATLDKIGYKNLPILHDNIENQNWKPPKIEATTVRVQCSTCQGGQCGTPILGRIFGRWR